jgi:hypothetical protein
MDIGIRGATGDEGRTTRIEVFPRIITIAREFGAGGARIAARVAAELGFQLWDQELVVHLARKANVEPSVLRELDERARDLLDDVISTSLRGAGVSGSQYRALLERAVVDLSERGGAVIVGRGANFLVAPEQALRVRIVCPLRDRIQRYACASRMDGERAERCVRSQDRERERFVRQLCGESDADPTQYDLVINTLSVSEDAAARIIATTYGTRFGMLKSGAREHDSPHAHAP